MYFNTGIEKYGKKKKVFEWSVEYILGTHFKLHCGRTKIQFLKIIKSKHAFISREGKTNELKWNVHFQQLTHI